MSFINFKNVLFDFVFISSDPGSNQVSPVASDCLVSLNLEQGLFKSLYLREHLAPCLFIG